jgi:predicted nuclease of predicted toxin-antitoxin system
MRFLVDENLPVDVAQLLQHEGHAVLYLAQSGYRGSTDAEAWSLAAREERIVITRDLDFPMPDLPRPPGLVLLRVPDAFTRMQIARVMSEFIASAAFQQVVGTITVVSPGRVRVRSI